MEKNKRNILEYIHLGADKYKYVLLICALGILLMALPSKKADTKTQANKTDTVESEYLAQISRFEGELEEALCNINGVGRTKIMLTAKHGYEPRYIFNGSGGEQEKKELVVIRGANGEEPVISSVTSPEYMGAVIICDGAQNASVRLEITEAVKSLTGISSDKIIISQMKK